MKRKLNMSLESISDKGEWTPVKYVLRKDMSLLSTKEYQKFVRKANKAVYHVLEAMAPGQGQELKMKCFDSQYKCRAKPVRFLEISY